MKEFLAVLEATAQAIATLQRAVDEKTTNAKPEIKPKRIPSGDQNNTDDTARDLVVDSIQRSSNREYQEYILDLVRESQGTRGTPESQDDSKSSREDLVYQIMHPRQNPIIVVASEILREAAKETITKGLETFSWLPSPIMPACATYTIGRDLYAGKTTVGEILFNAGLAFGALKLVQLAGRGIKMVYQSGKSLTIRLLDEFATFRAKSNTNPEVIPFVRNPHAGEWTTATISDDLVLCPGTQYDRAWYVWKRDPNAPFNVFGHGTPQKIEVVAQDIHPKALSQANLATLRNEGRVLLNAVQLARAIRTAPGYVKGKPVNLFSCECGKESNGIAQQLSDRMELPVSAFTEVVYISHTGKFKTISETTGQMGVLKTFYPGEGGGSLFHLIPLLAIPSVMLTGDVPEPEPRITNIVQESDVTPITNIPDNIF